MIRLFHISDVHFGLEDTAALAWVAECVARERPDAVAITGDLTMRARHREFAAAAAWIHSLGVPVTVEVGNHDLPYFNLAERFLDPYRRFRALQGAVDQGIALPGLAIVPLKTTARAQLRLNWSRGHVSERSLSTCLAALDALAPGTRALVACHHPLVETGTRGKALTRGGSRALAALAQRGVLGVLSGHVHDAFDIMHPTANGPVRMIGAGTLSQRLRATPAGFNELIVDGSELTVKVRHEASAPANR
ncbi:metallophosphoesterase family protein [Novosphingobium sp.]|uniref:metallophosphoesterase family protein n=1 Tax=Novosphingobium sp. TaxID=1874826 RepID=UPI003BA8FD4E